MAERNLQLRSLAKSFLTALGHTVHFAQDGVEALALLHKMRPQVLITEILLPKMDGLALCRAVKADSQLAATRVLIFSMLAASRRAQEAGADAFLAKPLAKEGLAAALARLLIESTNGRLGPPTDHTDATVSTTAHKDDNAPSS